MAGPTDQKTNIIGKIGCYSYQEERTPHATQGHPGKLRGLSGGRGGGENMGTSLDCGFHGKEW